MIYGGTYSDDKGKVEQTDKNTGYDGFIETDHYDLGNNGMFMNTEFDTLESYTKNFPGRYESHVEVFGKLMHTLLQQPDVSFKRRIDWQPIIYGVGIIIIVIIGAAFLLYRGFRKKSAN